MKIAIRGGHNVGVPGAHGIIDEVTEDRKYYKSVMNYLIAAGHEVIDVTPDRTPTVSSDLVYGVSRANAAKVDLFVSCHLNSGGGVGCETLYCNGSTAGNDYATKIVNAIAALGFTNRKSKVDIRNLYELRCTNMPAVIIEPLFVDSQTDVNLYNKIGYDRLGKAIAEAISGRTITANSPTSSATYPGYVLRYDLSKCDNNVKLIQQKLGLTADGYFGGQTLSKVKEFQKSHNLQPDGLVGYFTWKALFN